jgi:hypothetical protein
MVENKLPALPQMPKPAFTSLDKGNDMFVFSYSSKQMHEYAREYAMKVIEAKS